MKIKRIFSVIVCAAVLMSCFLIQTSAAVSYTEYYQYSGSAISDSLADKLTGYALNVISNSDYRYWFAVRVAQYQYVICFSVLPSDISLTSSSVQLKNGVYAVYDERKYSYQSGTNTTSYQVGISALTENSVTVSLNRSYILGNISGSFGDGSFTSDRNSDYLKWIFYVVLIFMLIDVAFQFIKKRWLIE